MSLPFNLQKLLPEALDVIRYLDKMPSADVVSIERATGVTARNVGKAIRRLVNYDYIQVDASGSYKLTTDGKIAAKQLSDYDANPTIDAAAAPIPTVKRRLTAVMSRALFANRGTDLYIGVNPPSSDDNSRLPKVANVELRVSAIGATLSANHISLEIPPDAAAKPGKLTVTPYANSKGVRLRIDIFQAFEPDSAEPLEKIYFDVPVIKEPAQVANMAKGADLVLRSPR